MGTAYQGFQSIYFLKNELFAEASKSMPSKTLRHFCRAVRVLRLTPNGELTLAQALPLVEGLDANFFSQCRSSMLQAELKKLFE